MSEAADQARERELGRREDRPVVVASGTDVFVITSADHGHVVAVCATREIAERDAAALSFATSIQRQPLWTL